MAWKKIILPVLANKLLFKNILFLIFSKNIKKTLELEIKEKYLLRLINTDKLQNKSNVCKLLIQKLKKKKFITVIKFNFFNAPIFTYF